MAINFVQQLIIGEMVQRERERERGLISQDLTRSKNVDGPQITILPRGVNTKNPGMDPSFSFRSEL